MHFASSLFWFAFALASIVLFGRFGNQFKLIVTSLFGVFRFDEFIQQTLFCLQQITGGVAALNRDAVLPKVSEEQRRHLDQIIGSAILAGCTMAIIAFLFVLNAAMFEVLLNIPGAQVFGSICWLAPLADAGIFVANGLLLLDILGRTHILPPFPDSAKKVINFVIGVSLLAGIIAVVTLNDWRLNNIESSDEPATAISNLRPELSFGPASVSSIRRDSNALKVASDLSTQNESVEAKSSQSPALGLSALMIACVLTTITSASGVIVFARYLWVLITGVLLIPVAILAYWIVPPWTFLWQRLEGVVQAIADICISICKPLVDTFRIPSVHAISRWHSKFELAAQVRNHDAEAPVNENENGPRGTGLGQFPTSSEESENAGEHDRVEKNGKPLPEFSFEF